MPLAQNASTDRILLIATRNAGKIAELTAMLAPMSVNVVGLDAFPDVAEVDETGGTFAENAILKASQYARATGLPAITDDSGLEVKALGGRPGVFSARYGGEATPFIRKMELLLEELNVVGSSDRAARFVCAMAVARTDGGIEAVTEGVCTGRIAGEPCGKGGFGYDPVFIPDGYERTFGELSNEVKAQISHRSRAFSQIIPVLARYFGLLT